MPAQLPTARRSPRSRGDPAVDGSTWRTLLGLPWDWRYDCLPGDGRREVAFEHDFPRLYVGDARRWKQQLDFKFLLDVFDGLAASLERLSHGRARPTVRMMSNHPACICSAALRPIPVCRPPLSRASRRASWRIRSASPCETSAPPLRTLMATDRSSCRGRAIPSRSRRLPGVPHCVAAKGGRGVRLCRLCVRWTRREVRGQIRLARRPRFTDRRVLALDEPHDAICVSPCSPTPINGTMLD